MGAVERDRSFTYFLTAVIVAGLTVLVFHVTHLRFDDPGTTQIFLLLGLLTVLGEVMPIMARRGDGEVSAITVSTTFSFALLLIIGAGYAIVAQASASLIDDAINRKPWWKALFNVAQYSLSIACAGWVFGTMSDPLMAGGTHNFEPAIFVPILLGGIAFFAVNNSIIGTAVTMSRSIPLRTYFKLNGEHIAFMGSIDTVLMALSPVVVVVAQRNLTLIPLLVLPLLAIHRSAKVTLEKVRLVEKLEEQVRSNHHQATHDLLTGLPNRVLLKQQISRVVESTQIADSRLAVMIMDLDRFKEVNDALGHANGDALLKQISERLQKAVRREDMVARLGGDEFAVMVPVEEDMGKVSMLAQRILKVFEEPFLVHKMRLHVDASIGIALYPDDGSTEDALMQRADVAMYHAKSEQTGYEFYCSEIDYHNPRRLALMDELRDAIEQGHLTIQLQPQMEMATKKVRGAEALVRWNHPYRGSIPPIEFLTLAEQTGLMRPLTLLVLDRALAEVARWHADGLDLTVSVNVAPQTLMDLDLPSQVARLLAQNGVPATALMLEITESGMMGDPRRTKSILDELTQMGVGISIDDFGTGYSSLAHIRTLPASEIKIDRSFVMGLTTNQNDAVIVRSTIDLARLLGLSMIAEGIEDEATMSELIRLGCEIGQGYLLGRPMEVEDFRSWLDDQDVERLEKLHVLQPVGSMSKSDAQQAWQLGS